MSGSRQKLLLTVLGVLLAAVALRYTLPSASGDAVGAASRVAEADAAVRGAVEALRLGDLERVPRSTAVGRDPWSFYVPPPPPPPPPRQPTAAELERLRQLAEERARLEAERLRRLAEEAARPKPPIFQMKYLGRFGPLARPIAVFSDGENIVNARQGEILFGKFEVATIGLESVDIKFVGFPEVPAQRLAVGR